MVDIVMEKNYEKLGFTLAEVLVTLLIIGVVAAMTIPGLRKTSEEAATAPIVNKAYSTIANATKAVETKEGGIRFLPWNDIEKLMDDYYIPQFNVMRNCKKNGGCFDSEYTTRSLDGKTNNDFQNSKNWYTFVTADGMYWAVAAGNTEKGICQYSEGTPAYIKNGCANFEVDTNGPKGPNTIGVDIFGFVVTPEGTFPMGGCPGCKSTTCKENSGTGWACTARIISEGKISW